MSQWARNNPELCAEGVRYEDVHDPDRVRQERKDGLIYGAYAAGRRQYERESGLPMCTCRDYDSQVHDDDCVRGKAIRGES